MEIWGENASTGYEGEGLLKRGMETGANTVGQDKRGRFTKERYGDWGELSLKG